MRKFLLWCLIAVIGISMLITLGLVGCKTTNTAETTAATEAITTATTTAAAETTATAETTASEITLAELPEVKEDVNLTIWAVQYDLHLNGFKNIIPAFNKKYPNIHINVEVQPDLLGKVRSAVVSGEGAELPLVTGTMLYELAVPGNIQPISPEVVTADFVKKEMLPEYYLQCNFNDQIWAVGLPDNFGEAGLVVNIDDFKAAGLEIPKAFESKEQLLEYAKKLAKYDENGKLTHSGLTFQEANDPTYLYSYIVDNGGKFFDNATQKFTFQSPEAKEVMNWFNDLFTVQKLDSVELGDSFTQLIQKTAAMAFMWSDFVPYAQVAFPDLNFAFVLKPPFKDASVHTTSHTDTWNMVIPKYVTGVKKDAAFLFLRYMMSEEGQLLLLDANPAISPLKKLTFENDFYVNGKGAYLAPLIESLKAGNERYWGPFMSSDIFVYDILWPNMQAILSGQTTVDEGLAKIDTLLNEQNAKDRAKYPELGDTTIYYDSGFGGIFD